MTGAVRWLASHEVDGVVAFRIGAAMDDTLVAEWSGLGRLVADRTGARALFEPVSGADERLLAKIRRGGVAMLLRHLSGGLAFHGACVALDGRALVLMGDSGAGKSTLAAWLVAQCGALLLSDDLVPIERIDGAWSALPLEPDHWLDSRATAVVTGNAAAAASEEKHPIAAPRRATTAHPLAAFVDLRFADASDCTIERVDGVEALAGLLHQTVRFAIDEPRRHCRELDEAIALCTEVPFLRLSRPRDLRGLPTTFARVDDWLRRGTVDP